MKKNIIQKWIYKDTIKFILFFLLCIYLLYFIIDFSIHGYKMFNKSNINFLQITTFYYHYFILFLNIFLLIAFMFAIIKVIYSMNTHRELVAIFSSGISKYQIAKPLFVLAFFICILGYFNNQLYIPKATKSIELFKENFLRTKKKYDNHIHTILLKDNQKLIYQTFNATKNLLLDVFLIKNENDIWHMKSLTTNTSPPQGEFVDHFIRDKDNKFILLESFENYAFFDMSFDKTTKAAILPYENRSISDLFNQYKNKKYTSSKEKNHILTQLNYKLIIPLFSFLIVIILFPYCTQFSRASRMFLLSFLSLVGFICFYVFYDAASILTQNGVFSPFTVLWLPYLIIFALFTVNFIKKA